MADNNTLREAMTSLALKEVDELTTRLEKVNAESKLLIEALSGHFEDAGNNVSDIIKHGVKTDMQIMQKTIENSDALLKKTNQELSKSLEMQRRLASKFTALDESIHSKNVNFQAMIYAGAAFIGALLANIVSKFF